MSRMLILIGWLMSVYVNIEEQASHFGVEETRYFF